MQNKFHEKIALSTLAIVLVASSITTVQARGAGGERELRGKYKCSEAGSGGRSARCGEKKVQKSKIKSGKLVWQNGRWVFVERK